MKRDGEVTVKRVLVLEDEETIREFLVINLRRAGYETTEAASGEQALEIFEKEEGNFDLALLDIMMPGIDGFEVCRRIRQSSSVIGIIMLTARTQETDKINGLVLGADDYVTKPFSPSELVARVDALYRRIRAQKDHEESAKRELRCGEYRLDLHSRELYRGDVRIELTQLEFQIMEYFFQNAGKSLKRAEILRKVWGEAYSGEEKIVDVNMRRLRMKVEEDPSQPRHLLTVWGQGYKWEE